MQLHFLLIVLSLLTLTSSTTVPARAESDAQLVQQLNIVRSNVDEPLPATPTTEDGFTKRQDGYGQFGDDCPTPCNPATQFCQFGDNCNSAPRLSVGVMGLVGLVVGLGLGF